MANGQPRPAFYVAVLLVVLGLVGLALWRYGAIGPKSQTGQFSADELKQMKGGAEAADSSGITTVKEYNYSLATKHEVWPSRQPYLTTPSAQSRVA